MDNISATENQLCGGGRYDDLIHALGGRPDTPACGFSYGMERLRLALAESGRDGRQTQVAGVAVDEADGRDRARWPGNCASWASRVETDVRERGVKGNLQYADKV